MDDFATMFFNWDFMPPLNSLQHHDMDSSKKDMPLILHLDTIPYAPLPSLERIVMASFGIPIHKGAL